MNHEKCKLVEIGAIELDENNRLLICGAIWKRLFQSVNKIIFLLQQDYH